MGLSLSGLRVASFLFLVASVLPAQAEVTNCKEIAALPAIVNTSGIWCLKKNLISAATTGNAIDVQVGAVTIDLNGWTLTGSVAATTQAVGIHSLNRTNVTIRNGTIRGFLTGIFLEGPGSINDVVEDMHVDQAQGFGIRAKQTVRAVIRNSEVTNTGRTTVSGNIAIFIESATSTTISNNIVNGVIANSVGTGIANVDSQLTEIRDNSILNVGTAFAVGIANNGSSFATIQNNRVLNGAILGEIGISSGSSNCINNVIHRYTTASTCAFNSGNVTPPN